MNPQVTTMTNPDIDCCPECDANVPADCDGSGEVICSECGEEVGHIGCVECMREDDEDDCGNDGGHRRAA